jgi:NCAIR mutase (PurE)-related protein
LELREILQLLRDGKIGIDEADAKIKLLAVSKIEGACLDISRELRKGVPEIVYAEGKSIEDLLAIVDSFLKSDGKIVITRTNEAQAVELMKRFQRTARIRYDKRSRVMVVNSSKSSSTFDRVGKVAVLTAGTADIGIAEEAKAVLEEMGCEAISFYDVGIAGIHRVFPAVKKCITENVAAVIVVAGMEGALASVISSLVSVPVIGVPSSSGYGMGGKGEGALVSMLQSCSPGLVVVNIDNGVGAAVAAALIAKRCRLNK